MARTNHTPVLETERLYLRAFTLDDLDALFVLHADEDVQRLTGEPVATSKDVLRTALRERIDRCRRLGYGRWAAFLKAGDRFVGWAGLAYLPEFDVIDLGYRFSPEFWGRGIATELAEGILAYGFETLQLERIVALALKEHVASIRVMEKVGMEFETFAPYEPGSVDAAWYACDAARWAARRPKKL